MAKNVDMTQFTAAMRKLSALSGADLTTVMTAEAGKVIETAIRYTPVADREKIKAQVTANTKFNFENGKTDAGHIYTTKAGKQWFDPGREGKWFLIMNWKVPPKVWKEYLRTKAAFIDDYRKTLARRLREALARRGLTASTWTQIARAIKANVKVAAYITKAKAPDGIGTGYVSTNASQCTVTGENSSEVLINSRTGQGIIDRALKSRAKYAEIAVRKGALNSMKSRARAFPEIFKET